MAKNKLPKRAKNKRLRTLTITLIIGLVANVVLVFSNFIVIKRAGETTEKLNSYRELQEKQIASVTKLCFDIGTLKGIRANRNSNYENRLQMFMTATLWLKAEYMDTYENVYEEICYKPLLLVSGRISEVNDPSIKEIVQPLFEEEDPNPTSESLLQGSDYIVKSNAFDAVRW